MTRLITLICPVVAVAGSCGAARAIGETNLNEQDSVVPYQAEDKQ